MAKVARSRKGQHFSSGDKVEISFHSEDLRVFALDA
jgi:hypothetical protein